MNIVVSEELRKACPQFKGAAVFATVENTPYSAELWDEIGKFIAEYRSKYTIDSIKDMPSIQATRKTYKVCGKDPSRYRPSGEALCRRILKGMDLYQIDTMVDLVNLASIAYGYSNGFYGYNRDEIKIWHYYHRGAIQDNSFCYYALYVLCLIAQNEDVPEEEREFHLPADAEPMTADQWEMLGRAIYQGAEETWPDDEAEEE